MRCDLICISHLRWDFVYQRPQHLMTRAAADRSVLFVEPPIEGDGALPFLATQRVEGGVTVVIPQLPRGMTPADGNLTHAVQLRVLADTMGLQNYGLWHYTPMAGDITGFLKPRFQVYDCLDDAGAFSEEPAVFKEREAKLFRQADIVFVAGRSLYRTKRHLHENVHCLPSAVDFAHFAAARGGIAEARDQASFERPRAGFFGCIDQRLDLELLRGLAELRPHLQIVMIGPLGDIDESELPRAENIHWLGRRSYDALPHYLTGWDVAILPFAHNGTTRFLTPTKTAEYLSAGRRVVSTPLPDIVHPYGIQGMVRTADRPASFASAIDSVLENPPNHQPGADRLLARMSWDETWATMNDHLEALLPTR